MRRANSKEYVTEPETNLWLLRSVFFLGRIAMRMGLIESAGPVAMNLVHGVCLGLIAGGPTMASLVPLLVEACGSRPSENRHDDEGEYGHEHTKRKASLFHSACVWFIRASASFAAS